MNIDTDPLSKLQEQYDNWAAQSNEANAAQQLDAMWGDLARTMTERAGILSGWLTIRKGYQKPSEVDSNIRSDVDKANRLLAEYKTICGGLAIRLSD